VRAAHSVVALALTAATSALAAQAAPTSETTWPTKGWPTGTPQAVGLNAKVLDSLDAEISAGRYGYVDRMLVIRRGRVAFDKSYAHDYDRIYADSMRVTGALNPHDETGPYNYYNPWWHPFYRREGLHTLQSVTKTIASVVIGTAVARNEFPSLDTPVLSFFDVSTVANVDARKRRMTIRHLLTMTAGLDWNESLPYADPNNAAVRMEASSDWVKFTIDRPMSEDPGARWNYNSGASALLAYIFRKATKTDIEEYAARHLFAPLGIQRWYWKRTPHGLVDSEGGLYLEARDLAKIWYLFLRNGTWDGRQVVTADWVKSSIAPAVPVASAPNAARYGLKWWLYPDPRGADRYVWGGSGFGGQVPLAFPDDDMVVVFNGWNILPGRPGLPRAQVTARLLNAIVER
jgi:CubicO group peptidase (beta-lactamase class C family)